jgi:type II secretory pathway component PulF
VLGGAESRRAGIYRNLAALEGSGIPLRTAIDKVRDGAVAPIVRGLDDGLPPDEAWAKAPGFAPLEVALVRAGTKSGQLVESFKALEEIFDARAKARRELALGFAYPVLLMHLAALIPNVKTLLFDGLIPYAKVAFVPILGLWGGIIGAMVVYRMLRKSMPAVVDGITANVPVVGALARKRSLVHAIQAFLALYRAGVPVREAVDGARDAASFAPIGAAFERIATRIDDGQALGDAWLNETALPEEVREAASTGSLTGKLEDTLGNVRRRLESEADALKKGLLAFLPILAYLAAALFVGYSILSMWGDYFSKINEAMK